jgi:hypothetical protein
MGCAFRLYRLSCLTITLMILSLITPGSARAEHPLRRTRGRVVTVRARPVYTSPPTSTLGTFEPTPYIMVRGSMPAGGGYTPLDSYGDQTMSLYGPFSPMRSVAAPVVTYTRGYDGQLRQSIGTSFSTPNLPGLTPVVYPTERNYYYGPRENRNPPWWTTGTNWIDEQ